MGMKSKTKTEIQIMQERLVYLAGKYQMTKSLYISDASVGIYEALGAKKIKKDDGKEVLKFDDDSTKFISVTYRDEYVNVAKKLAEFYKALNKLPNEKAKRICELRFVDGYSFREIAKMVDESEQNLFIKYRPIIIDVLINNGCKWCLIYDR